jgi:hypothetical protein
MSTPDKFGQVPQLGNNKTLGQLNDDAMNLLSKGGTLYQADYVGTEWNHVVTIVYFEQSKQIPTNEEIAAMESISVEPPKL